MHQNTCGSDSPTDRNRDQSHLRKQFSGQRQPVFHDVPIDILHRVRDRDVLTPRIKFKEKTERKIHF